MHAESRTILRICAKEKEPEIITRGRGIHMLESKCSSEEELLSVTFDYSGIGEHCHENHSPEEALRCKNWPVLIFIVHEHE